MKEIKSVTEKGIEYVDETGNPGFIDFELCLQQFLAYQEEQLGSRYDDEWKQFDREEWKTVGVRRAFAKPPFIEFFTTPPTTFEFSDENEFYELLYKMKKAGWRTIDGD